MNNPLPMYIHVVLYPTELRKTELKGKTVIVVDVLRGSSTIIYALAQGCKRIYPASNIKTAREKRKIFKNELILLGGERNGFKVRGFDLGNSPKEYSSKKVRGKTIVFTTTNCTKTLQLCKDAEETLICAFLNGRYVAKYLASAGRDIIFALAGRNDTYSMEDMLCAGMVIDKLRKYRKVSLSDTAISARIIYNNYRGRVYQGLLDSLHGQYLKKIGMKNDLIFCANTGGFNIIPRYSNGVIQEGE